MKSAKITRRKEIITLQNAILAANDESRGLGETSRETVERPAEAIGAYETEKSTCNLCRDVISYYWIR